MVPPARFERTTRGLGNRCSIHLSYGGNALLSSNLRPFAGGVTQIKPDCQLSRRIGPMPAEPFDCGSRPWYA